MVIILWSLLWAYLQKDAMDAETKNDFPKYYFGIPRTSIPKKIFGDPKKFYSQNIILGG